MADPTLYRSIVGALQYVSLTRPDVSFSVNRVFQFMHAPTEDDWALVKRILRYLKQTQSHGLLFGRSATPFMLQAFSDANWARNGDDRKSTGGYAIYLGSNLIPLSSQKQRTIARSSTESKYKALADAVLEIGVRVSLS
ncbi:uncharacterized mitochondrial protein AtMg00810-like [Macadamia integrifolia]|uniref:uncharacterized mitochondrial protein AtMg00810-like n=1 Tax=Macadamia integrifolia TaxID=60698 RepID=UPI001C52B73F|nr:uncharacterized mitochondrial protein AtMg00810-like [Macadamia integrifolia]